MYLAQRDSDSPGHIGQRPLYFEMLVVAYIAMRN
jgi:hypothetical protein